ncbi:MAG: 4-alpha-glucanotransferase, partial [Candidatus Omnitrophica bacterium]|nr:4-alpha-glucanotransferase [Candidatus Omnitrophota bacterium]
MTEQDISPYLLETISGDKWKIIGIKKRAGVVIPLFSAYSKESLGIGDFRDLKIAIDWVKSTGNSILQLLPMNEVGPVFCPYDANSSFALEPMYISIKDLGGSFKKDIQERIEQIRRDFKPKGLYVNYAIKKRKLELLWDIYASSYGSEDCFEFRKENHYWIDDFALFNVIKKHRKGTAWYEWEEKLRDRDEGALSLFKKEHLKEVDFEIWVQYHLYKQFKSVKEYAASRQVLLKGDLPILVSLDSADVWAKRGYFKLGFAAGAPPDMYCAKGQRWGMPTYNWERIKEDGFIYIRQKLKFAESFYDLLRIDHVAGIFRIWSIPYDEPLENKGLNGSFDPEDQDKWAGQGREILSVMAESSNMLLCAEDLGIIPRVCIDTLREFGIPGNDVQRWVKDWSVKHDFLDPQEYRQLTVAMLSTHDTTNWVAWWENEAGTVDEDLFRRKCSDRRRIDFSQIKDKLFDSGFSRHGRLYWKKEIDSIDKLVAVLSRPK